MDREGRYRMLEQIMNAPTMEYAARSLHAATMRQEVISNNIANVNTPNFKRSSVEFEDLLAKELGLDDDGNRLQMVRTHDKHLPMASFDKVQPKIEEDDTTTMRVDNNNVDVDIEMADLAKNQLYYNTMATELNGYIQRMKNTISSGQ